MSYVEEFKELTAAEKEPIFRYISMIRWQCKSCKEVQERKIGGILKRKRKPWELGISRDVTNFVSVLNSLRLPKELRKVTENYGEKHTRFDCENALKEITNIYNNLKENLS